MSSGLAASVAHAYCRAGPRAVSIASTRDSRDGAAQAPPYKPEYQTVIIAFSTALFPEISFGK